MKHITGFKTSDFDRVYTISEFTEYVNNLHQKPFTILSLRRNLSKYLKTILRNGRLYLQFKSAKSSMLILSFEAIDNNYRVKIKRNGFHPYAYEFTVWSVKDLMQKIIKHNLL